MLGFYFLHHQRYCWGRRGTEALRDHIHYGHKTPAFPLGSQKPGSQPLPSSKQAGKASQENDPVPEGKNKNADIRVAPGKVAQPEYPVTKQIRKPHLRTSVFHSAYS